MMPKHEPFHSPEEFPFCALWFHLPVDNCVSSMVCKHFVPLILPKTTDQLRLFLFLFLQA